MNPVAVRILVNSLQTVYIHLKIIILVIVIVSNIGHLQKNQKTL